MESTYDPSRLEASWYKKWETRGYFKPSGKGQEAYCIAIPPPNVTGSLHMGHGFNNAIMDALIRYHRMQGKDTLWQAGTDHAGIATQMVVERQLLAQGQSRGELGREAFTEKVWEWKAESGSKITSQLRRLGSSIDWSRERFTMDPGFSAAVEEVFIRLYEEGLIYRGSRLVNWDCKLLTAISDLEVINEEEAGSFWYFRYRLCNDAQTKDGLNYITIATTRPETLLGDTAVAVNPEDERFLHLVGQEVELPLCDRRIPIIADSYVDPEFGTGCVKITPAHDFNDYEVGLRHQLPQINILTRTGRINDNAPEAYRGLDRFDCRKQLVRDMENAGLLERVEPHRLKVPRGDRSGVVIEPFLTEQWYVATKSLAEPAINAVKNNDIEFVPKNWENTYFAWMRDIQDWCISRQLWWGHRIPAWYDQEGNIYVGRSEEEIRTKHQLNSDTPLSRDEDVLDTWFSSALWTFGTLGWPEQTSELDRFHPTDVLVTGFDIIFFWVARMIMMTLKFTGRIPFRKVYIHGLIRDSEGQKMSKSKGNVLDPIDLIDGIDLETLVKKRTSGMMQPQLAQRIEKTTRKEFPDGISSYGTDALRYTFYSLASNGRDINFDLGRIEGYRNFCNKIWNASRYVFMNTSDITPNKSISEVDYASVDRWIKIRFQQTLGKVNTHMKTFRFDLVSQAIYDFFWNDYCDWYLELTKPILWNEQTTPAQRNATCYTLLDVLEQSLRLAHPFLPFITEEIWQQAKKLLGLSGDTIMLQPYPLEVEMAPDETALVEIHWLQQIIEGIRNIRGELNISPGKPVNVLLKNSDNLDAKLLEAHRFTLCKLCKLESISLLNSNNQAPPAAMQLCGQMEVLVPLDGLIDVESERGRLQKDMTRKQQEIDKLTKQLSNTHFVERAPAEVVAKERDRLEDLNVSMAMLEEQFQRLNLLK